MNLTSIIVSTTIIYLFIIIAIRIFGKRELSQLSVIDLVFILLISNSVQNAMVGNDSTLVGGLIAAATLFIVNYLLKQLLYRSGKISTLIEGNPIMLIYEGKVIQKHLAQTEITREELETAVREHGVENIQDVNLAILEIDGTISILSHHFQSKTTRRRKAHRYIQK